MTNSVRNEKLEPRVHVSHDLPTEVGHNNNFWLTILLVSAILMITQIWRNRRESQECSSIEL